MEEEGEEVSEVEGCRGKQRGKKEGVGEAVRGGEGVCVREKRDGEKEREGGREAHSGTAFSL